MPIVYSIREERRVILPVRFSQSTKCVLRFSPEEEYIGDRIWEVSRIDSSFSSSRGEERASFPISKLALLRIPSNLAVPSVVMQKFPGEYLFARDITHLDLPEDQVEDVPRSENGLASHTVVERDLGEVSIISVNSRLSIFGEEHVWAVLEARLEGRVLASTVLGRIQTSSWVVPIAVHRFPDRDLRINEIF